MPAKWEDDEETQSVYENLDVIFTAIIRRTKGGVITFTKAELEEAAASGDSIRHTLAPATELLRLKLIPGGYQDGSTTTFDRMMERHRKRVQGRSKLKTVAQRQAEEQGKVHPTTFKPDVTAVAALDYSMYDLVPVFHSLALRMDSCRPAAGEVGPWCGNVHSKVLGLDSYKFASITAQGEHTILEFMPGAPQRVVGMVPAKDVLDPHIHTMRLNHFVWAQAKAGRYEWNDPMQGRWDIGKAKHFTNWIKKIARGEGIT